MINSLNLTIELILSAYYSRIMIAFLSGKVISFGEHGAVILAGHVGYSVKASPKSIDLLRVAEAEQTDVNLWIHHRITENSQDLYGFFSSNDQSFFLKLLNIQSIGPKVALAACESADEIYRGDVAALRAIPGIGEKTAKRIIQELGITEMVVARQPAKKMVEPMTTSQVAADVLSSTTAALASLGFVAADRKRMVELAASLAEGPMDEPAFIKLALQSARTARTV